VPIRQRQLKQHKHQLTLNRFMALTIGPERRDVEMDGLELLHLVWLEHRHRFPPSSWAHQFWVLGHDIRSDGNDEFDPDCGGLPGLPSAAGE
jgi:hypothetical protein